MKVAVTSQNFRTVTNHAGRARRYIIFDVADDGTITEVDRLDLAKDYAFAEFSGNGPHPVDVADVVISESFGPGFVRRMEARNIIASLTDATEPVDAVRDYLANGQRLPEKQGLIQIGPARSDGGGKD